MAFFEGIRSKISRLIALSGSVVLSLVGLFGMTNPAHADPAYRLWDGGGATTNMSEAANWDGDTLPANGDYAIFADAIGGSASKSATFDASFNITISSMAIGTMDGMSVSTYSGTVTLARSMTLSQGLMLYNGTFNGGSQTISMKSLDMGAAGPIGSGTFTSTSGTMTLTEAFHHYAGTFNHNSGTIVFSGASVGYTSASTQTFNNLTVNMTDGATVSGNNKAVTIVGNLILTDGIVNDLTPTVQGNVTIASTFDGGTNQTLTLSGSGTQTLTMSGTNYSGDFAVNKSGGSASLGANFQTVTASQDFTLIEGVFDLAGYNFSVASVGAVVQVQDGATLKLQGGETITANPGSPDIQSGSTVNYSGSGTYSSLIVGNSYHHLTFSGTGSWTHTSTLDVNGNLTNSSSGTLASSGNAITLAGNWANSGTYTPGSNTVTLDGTTQGIGAGATFYNLTTAGSGTKTMSAALDVNNNLTIGASTTLAAAGFAITLAGNWVNSGTFTPASNTVTLDGTTQGIGAGASFYNLTTAGSGTKTMSAALDVDNNLTIGASTTLAAAGFAITLGGNWVNSGTFTPASNTVTFDGTTQGIGAGASFYNITTAGSGTKTMSAALDVDNNLTIGASTTLAAAGFAITLGGNWVNSGTFTPASNTVTLDGTTQGIGAGASFYNLTTAGSGTKTMSAALDVDNNFTIGASTTLAAAGFAITLGGNWVNSGTFTPASNTVTLDGTTQGIGAGASFYNLTTAGSGTKTHTGTLDVNGNLTIGASTTLASGGQSITLAGNWANSGTYTSGANTVTLDGTDQSIAGSASFNNLTKSVASAATLTYTAGTTQTIAGTLTLAGASGQRLSLRSSSTGTSYTMALSSAAVVSYLDVKDSTVTGAAASCMTLCLNSQHNSGWLFPGGGVKGPSSGSGAGLATSIVLTAPTGSETPKVGDIVTIEWNTVGGYAQFVIVSASTNAGVKWTPLVTVDGGSFSSYVWRIPASFAGSSVFVRAEATDLASVYASAASTVPFKVTAAAATTVVKPVVTAPVKPGDARTAPSPVTGKQESVDAVAPGDLIRSPSFQTVYLVTEKMTRRPFLDAQTFFTYEDSFANVRTVTDATMPTLPLGMAMLPKASRVLVKIQSDPKTYAVADEKGVATLHAIPNEASARAWFGASWADYVIDMPVTSFQRFAIGADASEASHPSFASPKKRKDLKLKP